MRNRVAKLVLLTTLVAGAILLVPAVASADAHVMTRVPCLAYADAGTSFYSGYGTNVITDTGDVALSCHLSLVYGTPVAEPTWTTYGNCELLRLPSGQAELNCHYALIWTTPGLVHRLSTTHRNEMAQTRCIAGLRRATAIAAPRKH